MISQLLVLFYLSDVLSVCVCVCVWVWVCVSMNACMRVCVRVCTPIFKSVVEGGPVVPSSFFVIP